MWRYRVVALLLCAGCAHNYVGPITGKVYTDYALIDLYHGGPEYDREVKLAEYLKLHPRTGSDLKRVMLEGKIQVGMTKEQVIISWGAPRDVHRTVFGFSSNEQWIYGDPLYGAKYLYFDNDKLTSWQE